MCLRPSHRSLLGRARDLARGLAHPVPAFFHLIFKVLAIVVYMFGSFMSNSFVNIFIICMLLLAFDFWTVKNVTGRLMVGLRWNSVNDQDGSTTWKFEAQEEGLTSTSLDVAVFWVGLLAPGVIWVLLGVSAKMLCRALSPSGVRLNVVLHAPAHARARTHTHAHAHARARARTHTHTLIAACMRRRILALAAVTNRDSRPCGCVCVRVSALGRWGASSASNLTGCCSS